MRSLRSRGAISIAGLVALAACARAPGGAPMHSLSARYEIRDTAEYSNMIYGGRMGVLYRDGAAVDSIDLGFGVHAVPGGVLFLPVRTERDAEFGDLVYFTEHVLHDGRSSHPLGERLPRFDPHFSSPAVIDSVLYYWGMDRDAGHIYRIYAMRYDFIAIRADSAFLFRAPLATDNPFHFEPPAERAGWIAFETYGRTFRLDPDSFGLQETANGEDERAEGEGG